MNPLNNMFRNNLSQGIGQARNLMNQMSMFSNPMSAIQNNPQFREVAQMLQGRNPKDVFYQMCKERNVDPNYILGQLK